MARALTAVALAASSVANAQFFSSLGDVLSTPANVFPVPVNQQSLNLAGSAVVVGNTGTGILVVNPGASLTADALSLGNNGTGIGSVTLIGPGTQFTLSGISNSGFNRLEVGNWGTGSLSVTSGAVIDATAACAPGQRCNAFVGNAAGSSGVLNIDGVGSRVSTIGFMGIGQSAVFTQAVDGFTFGTPGGITNGAVNVTGGGRLETQTTVVGQGPNTAAATGTELGIGSVVIDGAGSQWLATRNTVSNGNASVVVGALNGGRGTLIVRNGGQLTVDGTGGSNTNFDVLQIGNNGGRGDATVTGIGSNITVRGNNPVLGVGNNGGQGTFNALAGATVNTLFFNVGTGVAGTTGSAVIDGTGTTLTLSGVGTPGLATANAAGFMNIGRNGGSGQVTVSNGAQVVINDGGLDSRGSGSPGMNVARDLGSTGSLTITGAGSVVRIASTSLGVATNDNNNPFMSVGRFDAGTNGSLTVSAGGKLILEGNAVSTSTDVRTTYLGIGGSSDTLAGGTGSATVTGAGSEIRLTGSDAFLTVGRGTGAVGTLTVTDQGSVSAGIMNVGRAGGNGALLVDAGTLNFSGQFADGSGAGLSIGNRGGTGVATITSGSQVNIANLGTGGAAVNVAGTAANPLGTGTLTLSGGSQINITAASGLATFSVGRDGTGTANITQGSTVNIGDGAVHVGRLVGGSGSLTIDGGSQVLAGNVNIGGSSDTVAGGTGGAIVSGLGSLLRANSDSSFIGVGRLGTGDLTVSDAGSVESTILHIGRGVGGVGSLTVDNARIDLAGQQTSGNLSGARFAVGVGGGTGTADIRNGSVVTVSNLGSDGAAVLVGGTGNFPLGTGTLNVSNSQIIVSAAPGLARFEVGHDGTGTANLNQASTVDIGGGSAFVGRLAGSTGTLDVGGGSRLLAGQITVGGSGDATPGGVGLANVHGLGSELRASGASGSIAVGQGGIGTLSASSQSQITGTVLTVGSGIGGVGTLTLSDATVLLSGQQANGNGAALNVGVGGGLGTVTLSNSTLTVTNPGTGGASINVGGSALEPGGTGTFLVTNSAVNLNAAPGLGSMTIGGPGNGSGTASFTGSTLNLGDGSLVIAGTPGSTGTLSLSGGTTASAGYVGVGTTPGNFAGGVGRLVVNDSSLNAATLDIGAGGRLSGNNAQIHVVGDVTVAGTIDPGNSPGRIVIFCNIITLPGSAIILDVLQTATGFDVDNLIIGNGSTFDLSNLNLVFNFLGDSDPNAFAASGGFNLDTFFRSGTLDLALGLSTVFAAGQTWADVINTSLISAVSSVFDVTNFSLAVDGTVGFTAVSLLPEPSSLAMMLIGLMLLAAVHRQRRRFAPMASA